MSKLKPENVLIIGDTHIPYEHKHYLDFCKEMQQRCKCGTVVHIGDLVDNHSMSYHEHDPDGPAPKDEITQSIKHLQNWYKAFPKLRITWGNHDRMVDRKGKTAHLPSKCFKQFREIWELPNDWVDGHEFIIHGVKYVHGTKYSGKNGHTNAAYDSMISTVIGHLHSHAGVGYIKTAKKAIFGLNVGCGINVKSFAMAYGKGFRHQPILGCGVVTDRGEYAQFMPMKL